MKPLLLNFNDTITAIPNRDYHIHTTFTDGKSTVEEYFRAGIDAGLQAIVFTEHVRKSSVWYSDYVETVEALRGHYKNKIDVFHGIETKVINMDGELDATDEMLDTAELVLGSVHRFPGFDSAPHVSNYKISENEFAQTELQLGKAILKNPDVDVLAHPMGMYIRKFQKDVPLLFIKELIADANRYSTAIEINCSYLKDITLDTKPFFQMNPRISMGSDAHHKDELGKIIQYMKKIIQTG